MSQDLLLDMTSRVSEKTDRLLEVQRNASEEDRELSEVEKEETTSLREQVEDLEKRMEDVKKDVARKEEMERSLESMKRHAAAAKEHKGDPVAPGEVREVEGGVILNPEPERDRESASFMRDTRGNVYSKAQIPVIERDVVYTPGGEHNFWLDMARSALGGGEPSAHERLSRHEKRHADVKRAATVAGRRAVTSGNLEGQVVPQYLSREVAMYPTGGRPFLDFLGSRDLPDVGIVIYLPRINTPSDAGFQASEGDAFTSTDPSDMLLGVNVRTITSFITVSVQGIERGVHTEDVLWATLLDRLDEKQDAGALNDDGQNGKLKGLLPSVGADTTTTWTEGTASNRTFVNFWPQLTNNVGKIWEERKRPPDFHLAAPRRWTMLSGTLDSTGRPVLLPGIPTAQNPAGLGPAASEFGMAGVLATGFPVLVDANMPVNLGTATNQDHMVTGRSRDLMLWESPLVTVTAKERQATNGLVDLIARRYCAFTSEWQPDAVGKVAGTGMVI